MHEVVDILRQPLINMAYFKLAKIFTIIISESASDQGPARSIFYWLLNVMETRCEQVTPLNGSCRTSAAPEVAVVGKRIRFLRRELTKITLSS